MGILDWLRNIFGSTSGPTSEKQRKTREDEEEEEIEELIALDII
jgi:hypothetical protein